MPAVLKLIENPVANAQQIPPLRKNDDGTVATSLLVALYGAVRDLINRFNGQISLGEGGHGERAGSIDAQYINVQTPVAADEEFEVPHGLGRIPVGAKIAYCKKPVVIYAGENGWTETSIYLKCSATFLSGDANAQVKLLVW